MPALARPITVDCELAAKMATTPMPERREQWRRVAREPYTAGEIQRAVASLEHMLLKMEADLGKGPWLAGSQFSLADTNMAPYIVRLHEIEEHGVKLSRFPRIADWWARVQARPAFARAKIEAVKFEGSAAAS